MSDNVSKARANPSRAKENQQERASAFWQKTLDAGRQQKQASQQMAEAERQTRRQKSRQARM
jgi:hypothetical protein